MTAGGRALLDLLPAAHRLRDDRAGGPLRELLEVVADQVAVLENDVERLRDDAFVETCASWVLPYIGDLLGIEGLPPAPLSSRAEVGHTVGLRRRKGTAAALEQLAADITGLRARAIEYFALLAATQHLNHLRPEAPAWLALRTALRMERVNGPFESLAGTPNVCHAADVRGIASGRGRHGIPNVGVVLWRAGAGGLTRSPLTGAGGNRFRLHPLGIDAPVVNPPRTEDEVTSLAMPLNVPEAVSRRAFAAAPEDYYGEGRSVFLEVPPAAAGAWTAVPVGDVRVCHLGDWGNVGASPAAYSLDPELGRLVVAAGAPVPRVSVHHQIETRMGGGEYERGLAPDPAGVHVETVDAGGDLAGAIASLPAAGGVVEVTTTSRFDVPAPGLALTAAGRAITLRAAPGARVHLALATGAEITASGDAAGSVVLDGVMVSGGPVRVPAPAAGSPGLGAITLRHCTLVPGLAPNADGSAGDPAASSLVIAAPGTRVRLERSVTGAVRLERDSRLDAVDSVIDATTEDGWALRAPGDTSAGGAISLEGVTVIGRIHADALDLVSNSILLARADPAGRPVEARRRQEGCVRFSYVPPGSRTPRRHRCQPADGLAPARVRPVLSSARHPRPGYARLAGVTASQILRGADDESEMGAFHHLNLQQREAHLRARLDEHTRFGLEVGVLYAGAAGERKGSR